MLLASLSIDTKFEFMLNPPALVIINILIVSPLPLKMVGGRLNSFSYTGLLTDIFAILIEKFTDLLFTNIHRVIKMQMHLLINLIRHVFNNMGKCF